MFVITLNGNRSDIDETTSVTALLDANGYAGRAVAVEINRNIVPKSAHAQHLLRDGDRVEIVEAIGGG
ncbi:MAG: sulfur carrier protein ThiS [Rudaea sp.]